MKNKSGFIFVETIIVVTVLTVVLLTVYSSFTAMTNIEKNRLRYNDPNYLYRAYFVTNYFKQYRLKTLTETMSTGEDGSPVNLVVNLSCTSGIFSNNPEEVAFCQSLLSDFHVNAVYLAYYDLSVLKDCRNQIGVCETLMQMSNEAASFVKTLPGKGEDGYRIIFEFLEDRNGKVCTDPKSCVYTHVTLGLKNLVPEEEDEI